MRITDMAAGFMKINKSKNKTAHRDYQMALYHPQGPC